MTARSSLLRRSIPGARPARRTSSVVAALAALAPFASLTMIAPTDSWRWRSWRSRSPAPPARRPRSRAGRRRRADRVLRGHGARVAPGQGPRGRSVVQLHGARAACARGRGGLRGGVRDRGEGGPPAQLLRGPLPRVRPPARPPRAVRPGRARAGGNRRLGLDGAGDLARARRPAAAPVRVVEAPPRLGGGRDDRALDARREAAPGRARAARGEDPGRARA